ncbi:MAG: ATP-dependent DNA helicase [Patescibacteria group bacterium]
MNQEFAAAFKQLNKAQLKAVEAIDGPVLVVAGPGTGKTQLLSLRVANILHKTDADPSAVLCLTFTNFAATNMRDRLATLVGPEAHNVMVRTFHSFAAEIMSLYPDYFWNGALLNIAPDAVQLEIIQDILAKLPLDNPLASKFAGNYTALSDVQQALRLSKEAGLTPSKLKAMIEVNDAYLDVVEPLLIDSLGDSLSYKKLEQLAVTIDSLPDQQIDEAVAPLTSLSTVIKNSLQQAIVADQDTGKTTNTGKWKRQWLQTVNGEKGMFDERRRNAWWLAAADVYATYRATLHGHDYYDYSDMIIEVTTQLEQNPELLASVQERFLYVLIDEFQDTNAAQLRLAHLVATHSSSEGKPNLMAVGDDDQSIFAFNGAEINNMLSFRRTYPSTQLIVLQDNYRSTQAILDASATVIEQADDRLVKREVDLNKNLKAANGPESGKIQHAIYPTREHQLSAIAKRVQAQCAEDQTQTIAVLARNHSSLRQISSLLNELKVPISYEQQNNVLDHPLIQQICLLAEIATAIKEGDKSAVNYNLARLLQHPVWQVEPRTLWQLAIDNYREADWMKSLHNSDDKRLVILGDWLLWLARQSSTEPLPVMLEHLVGLRQGELLTSPLRDYFLSKRDIDNTYLEGLSAIQTLRRTTDEFVTAREGHTGIADFVRLTRLHRELDRPITDQSWFVSGDHAVQLMTVHKAKGLEFDTVYVLDTIEDNWQPRHIGRKPPANLPLQPYGEQYDDYVRLLYVAATRAKSSLIVSSFNTDSEGRALLATPLISALPTDDIGSKDIEPPIEVLESTLMWPRLETKDEKTLLKKRLEGYQLSVTALLQFLDVSEGGPQHFLERQLLRLPDITTSNMAYGTAIHKALQTAQQLTNAGKFKLPLVLESYKTSLATQPIPLPEIERYLSHGEQTLRALFGELGFTLNKSGQAEIAINQLTINQVPLSGKLDHINLAGDELIITDYKTGKPLSSFDTRNQTKMIKAWRHRTQLVFYALLASQSGRYKTAKSIKAQMIYVEAESSKELSLALDPDQASMDRLEKLMGIVWRHISELNFPDISNYSQDAKGIAEFEQDLLDGKV